MQEQPSEGRPYKSRFGGGYITGVQYLAENMCARLAKRDRVELPERFWLSQQWDKEFRLQTIKASKLLKDYRMEAIIAALRTTRGKQIYSLGAQSMLMPIIKDEQEKLDQRQVVAELKAEVEPKPEPQSNASAIPAVTEPRPNFVAKPSLLNKLRDI